MTRRDRSIATFTAALAAGAVVTTVVATVATKHTAIKLPDAAGITALLAAAEYLVLRYRSTDHVHAVNLFDAVLAPAIFVLPPLATLAAVVIAQTAITFARRNTLLKGTFNVAQWAGAASAGSLVFLGFRSGATLSPRNVAALVLALLVVALYNQLAFTNVMRIASGRGFRSQLRSLAPMFRPGWQFGWPLNTAFGLLFVAALQWSRAAIVLFVPPLLALHWAYRAYGTAAADRTRVSGLHRATRALAVPVDTRTAIPGFLSEVRSCFDAAAAELVLVEGDTLVVHRFDGGHSVLTEPRQASGLVAQLLAAGAPVRLTDAASLHGSRDCLSAPLERNGEIVGILCTYNRSGVEGFEAGELDVLHALAQELANALEKGRLVSEVFEERRKLSEIVTHASDGIMTLDARGIVLSWNPALESITGFRAEDMTGNSVSRVLEHADAPLAQWTSDTTTLPPDVAIRTRDGRTRLLSCSYTPIASAEQPLLIVVARDVTSQREVERLKDDFVATVSHELRTPLTPIKAWANTMLNVGDAMDPAQRAEGLRAMLRQADRLEHLVTNLLQVSKVERGLSERPEHAVNVDGVVAKCVAEFRAVDPKREIRLHTGPAAPSALGDDVWIEQIIANLLSNALKYAPAAERIDVEVTSEGEQVLVRVSDRGPGIPQNEADRIFERFHRLGDHMTRAQGGAGLGLYIARQLATSIGGTLTVGTRAGGGATFILSLRAADRLVVVA